MIHRTLVHLTAVAMLASFGAGAWASETSAPLVDAARRMLRQRDVPGALKSLEAAVKADSGDPDAQILYQDVLRRDQPAQALLAQYRAAVAAQPEEPLVAFLAARLLKPEDGRTEYSSQAQKFPDSAWPHAGRAAVMEALGKMKDAAAAHDAAIAANPREPWLRVAQARSFERAGQWVQAAEIWKLAVGLRPADRALVLGFGEALRRAGALDDAVLQLEAAAKLDPTDPEPPYRIGLARLDAVRYDDALKAFDTAIALDKGYVEPCCGAVRASIARASAAAAAAKRAMVEGDLAPAIAYGTKAVAADGASPAAHIALGNAEEAAAEIVLAHAANALREYEAALIVLPATNPERVRALVGKAYVLLLVGRPDDAIVAADMAIGQDAHAVAAYLTAGRALAKKGEHEAAIKKYYTPGLKAAPDDAKLRHARGIAYWDIAKLNDAKKDLEAAVLSEPRSGRFLLSAGELYYQLKMYPQASAALVAAADVRPYDPATWRALGRTCTSLKKWEDSAAAFEEVVRLVEGGPPAPGSPPAPGPAGPPAPGNPQPPAGGPTPPAPADPNAPAGSGNEAPPATEPKFATSEHLYLTVIYADHLDKKEEAKAHARKWLEQGGTNPNLDSWVQNLLK